MLKVSNPDMWRVIGWLLVALFVLVSHTGSLLALVS